MNKVLIISPYFGRLPENMPFWVKSVSLNDQIDFLLVTDQDLGLDIPENLKIFRITFKDFTKLVINKLDLRCGFDPYKICDFKPAFGRIFSDFIDEYLFWGHCDLDLIFGKFSIFLPDSDNYLKFLDLGHLSIYRNIDKVNSAFKLPARNLKTWDYVKNSKIIWVYDETYWSQCGGINGIITDQFPGKLINGRSIFSDVNPKYHLFYDTNDEVLSECFFKWIRGSLYKISIKDGRLKETQVLYVHFQKRDVVFLEISSSEFLIFPLDWKEVSSFDDAINLLKERVYDKTVNPIHPRSEHNLFLKKRRSNKFKIFILEFLSLKVSPQVIASLVINRIFPK